jgi:hypothetical protein
MVARERYESQRKLVEAQGIAHYQGAIPSDMLKWKAIEATTDLSKSHNSKIVVVK